MQYQPFLISNLRTAKSIGLEPWLTPEDGFPTIINAHVNKGVLEKRRGWSLFAQMKHGAVAQTATSIQGIKTYLKNGMPDLLIMDTKRCNFYNPVDETMTDISSDLDTPADIFSGKATDFFHFCNWLGVGYMVNNVDQIHKYEGAGSAVVPFNYQISSDSKTNHLDTCRFIFVKDDRLCFLDTVEFGDWCPQRFRYSPVLSVDGTQSGGGYVDCPTQQRVCAAGFVGKDLAVYMQGAGEGSLWRIKSTGNADIPFRWDKVTETEVIRSPYSGVEIKDGLAAVGATNIVFYDGFKIKDMDIPNLRDILDEFNDVYVRSVFSYNQKEERHLLLTFADSSSSSVDRILDYNIIENNWTVHKSEQSFFINCIGGFNGQMVPTWLKADDVYTGADGALMSAMDIDSREILGSPSPFTLIGCRNSRVYKWNDGNYDGTDDDNGKIEIDIRSGRWNPFTKIGRKAKLQKIDFFVNRDSTASFLASLYKDAGDIDSDTAYKSKTLTLSGTANKDKIWVPFWAGGEVANFHQLKISHTEKANRPRIHALVLYMKPAGHSNL